MQKRFNAAAVYVDPKYCSLPTLPNKTWNFWTRSRCVNSINHLMISLPFCFKCQTILLEKNSNRAIILVIKISSVFISLKTSLMQTLDSQQCCWEETGSWMRLLRWGFLARVGLWFPFPFVVCFLDVFLAILWLLMDVAGQLAVSVPGCGAAPPALS